TTPQALEWRPADAAVDLGLPVFALAASRAGGLHASFGLVSSTGRSFRSAPGRRIGGTLDHTAPLPRGSSGRPLGHAHGPPGTPAAAAGVQQGDLIVRVAGDDATRVDTLFAALDGAGPGGSLPLTVVRGVEEHALTVELDAPAPEVG